jgi:hypothetical protein
LAEAATHGEVARGIWLEWVRKAAVGAGDNAVGFCIFVGIWLTGFREAEADKQKMV